MKRYFAVLLACILLCTAALPASAKSTALRLDVSDAAVFAGDTLVVTLSLSDALPDVGALEVHLLYDADAVTLQSVSAGKANDALQVIRPAENAPYTGVLFAYDYGADGNADKSFRADLLLTAEFTVRDDVRTDTLHVSAVCVAAQDTAFRPLPLSAPEAVSVPVLPFPTVEIHDYVPERTLSYRASLTLRADVTNDVEGGEVCWFADGAEVGAGRTHTFENLRSDVHVQAQYRYGTRTLARSQTQTVHVKTGFFARLAAFFRALFGTLPKVLQSL